MNILDLVFPKRCVGCKKQGAYLCDKCFSYLSFDIKSLCLVCNRPSINGLTHPGCSGKYTIDGCFSSLSYNKTPRKLIFSFKYKPYLTDLRQVLSDLFYEGLIQNEQLYSELQKKNWVLAPIPLYSSKLKKRGYNQSEILTEELGKRFGFKTQNLLKRVKNTKTQVGLKVEERRKNIKGAFSIIHNSKCDVGGRCCDDGFNSFRMRKCLKKSGSKKSYWANSGEGLKVSEEFQEEKAFQTFL